MEISNYLDFNVNESITPTENMYGIWNYFHNTCIRLICRIEFILVFRHYGIGIWLIYID
jgi:hypothetical protein